MIENYFDLYFKDELEPEEKLAIAVISDWIATMKWIVREKRRSRKNGKRNLKKVAAQWRKERNWPYTDNAKFWVVDVLNGNLMLLHMLAEDFKKLYEGEDPVHFPKSFFKDVLDDESCCFTTRRNYVGRPRKGRKKDQVDG